MSPTTFRRLALPRPKMLKRLLVDAASLGIKNIVLVNAAKVDKSYWQTPNLKGELLREKLLLGLEQAGDPVMPSLRLAPRFRPFVEDELDQWAGPGRRLVAHPGPFPELPRGLDEPATLAIGWPCICLRTSRSTAAIARSKNTDRRTPPSYKVSARSSDPATRNCWWNTGMAEEAMVAAASASAAAFALGADWTSSLISA
mgnify:CR=1 FL=1